MSQRLQKAFAESQSKKNLSTLIPHQLVDTIKVSKFKTVNFFLIKPGGEPTTIVFTI
jgi:hypothetical protein